MIHMPELKSIKVERAKLTLSTMVKIMLRRSCAGRRIHPRNGLFTIAVDSHSFYMTKLIKDQDDFLGTSPI